MLNLNSSNLLASWLYIFLVQTSKLSGKISFLNVWDRLWNKSREIFKGPVFVTIHGRRVIVNYGYTYPVTMRRFPKFNAPLVELAHQAWKLTGNPISVVDVGAAIGDTILLLHANLYEALGSFVCVEGDAEFFYYLNYNLSNLSKGRLLNVLLSDQDGMIPDLVRIHSGTASAQGKSEKKATTLSVEITEDVDVVKIDVDGFDGRVLWGAMELLNRCRPAVIFEWHPLLCKQTQNNWVDHFNVLTSCGYDRFIWFTKYGDFSHFSFSNSKNEVAALAEYCMGNVNEDLHYDVVALHETSGISLQSLARLEFATNRPSLY